MKFSLTAVLAFVASAIAQTADFDPITVPASGATYAAGSTLKIEWTTPAKYSGKTIAISLIGGATQGTQVPLIDIAAGVSNDALSYSWVIPATLGDKAFYGLVFKLESDTSIFQYSNPFHISASTGVSSSVVSTTAAATSTAASTTGVVTISLSSKPAGDYTTVVPVYETTTVPCNTTTVAPYVPPVVTAPTVKPYSNATFTTAVVPPVKTTGGNSGSTAVPTPVVTGAGARFAAGPIAVFGGLLVAAFAL